jgi:hypothetical protein
MYFDQFNDIYSLRKQCQNISILKDWKSPIETLMLESGGNPPALAGGYFIISMTIIKYRWDDWILPLFNWLTSFF